MSCEIALLLPGSSLQASQSAFELAAVRTAQNELAWQWLQKEFKQQRIVVQHDISAGAIKEDATKHFNNFLERLRC